MLGKQKKEEEALLYKVHNAFFNSFSYFEHSTHKLLTNCRRTGCSGGGKSFWDSAFLEGNFPPLRFYKSTLLSFPWPLGLIFGFLGGCNNVLQYMLAFFWNTILKYK